MDREGSKSFIRDLYMTGLSPVMSDISPSMCFFSLDLDDYDESESTSMSPTSSLVASQASRTA